MVIKMQTDTLKKIEFDSNLWEVYQGAYGPINQDLAELINLVQDVPDQEKVLYLDTEPESDYRIAFENTCEQLTHQMSFYPALYLAMPYLVSIYEQWKVQKEFQWQLLFLTNIGRCLATDFEHNHPIVAIKKELLDSYWDSIAWIKKEAEQFLWEYFEKIKKLDSLEMSMFFIGLTGILGSHETAFVLELNCWSICYPLCVNCGYLELNIELDKYMLWNPEKIEELHTVITPALSVIGQWDKKSFDNTYLWLSNLVYDCGEPVLAEKLSYYFGTFTCPKCGHCDGPVIDLIIKGLFEGYY